MGRDEAFVWGSGIAADGLLSQVLSTMDEGVVILGDDGAFIGHNRAAETILGLTSDELLGRKPTDERWKPVHPDGTYFPPEDHPAVRTMESGDPHNGIMGVSRPDGSQRWIRVSSHPLFVGGTRYTAATFADVTELQAASGLAHQPTHNDLLTDVPIRIMFEQLVEATLERTSESRGGCAVIAAGLDHFGSTNKHLGSRGADTVLVETAQRVREFAGEHAAVGRIGDDQFAMLLLDPGPDDQVRAFAEELRQALSAPVVLDGEDHLPSVTIGVAVGRAEGGYGLITSAVEALEAAKSRERGSIRFFDGRDPREWLVYQQSQGIRRAIADRVARLWYQPIRDLSNGEQVGAEALFRVDVAGERVALTPDLLGVLGPRIARHVLTILVEDATAMHDAGTLPPYLAVNLTGPDLLSDVIHEQVLAAHAALVELGSALTVEISEQLGLHDLTGVRPTIESLRGEGIQVALDDFGTGANSLAQLRELTVDAIKLDSSFVRGAMDHATDRAIVKAAVALADELHLTLIAEGVETEEILAFIRGAGIHFAQGFLFDRPPESNGD